MKGQKIIHKNAEINTAMILAAGLGTRIRSLSNKVPKPLIKVNGVPLIDHVINRLEEGGIKKVVVNLHHLGTQIKNHLSKRKNIKISFSWEKDVILDTGGGVKLALPKLGDNPFWVVNSDSIWLNGPTLMMERMLNIWDEKRMDALALLNSTVDSHGYDGLGDFILDTEGRASRRNEGEVVPWLFTGIQIIHPRVFENSPKGPFSLNLIYDEAINKGKFFGMVHDGEWFHVGTPEGHQQIEDFMKIPFAGKKRR